MAVSGNTVYLAGAFTRIGPSTGCGVPLELLSGAPILLTVFACGAQVYAVNVAGLGASGLAPRILASVRCRVH